VRIITFCARSRKILQQGLSCIRLKIRAYFPAEFKGLILSFAHVKELQFDFEDGRLGGGEPFINYLFVNRFIWMLFQAIMQQGGDLALTLARLEFSSTFLDIL